jgi:hypothetical protein
VAIQAVRDEDGIHLRVVWRSAAETTAAKKREMNNEVTKTRSL